METKENTGTKNKRVSWEIGAKMENVGRELMKLKSPKLESMLINKEDKELGERYRANKEEIEKERAQVIAYRFANTALSNMVSFLETCKREKRKGHSEEIILEEPIECYTISRQRAEEYMKDTSKRFWKHEPGYCCDEINEIRYCEQIKLAEMVLKSVKKIIEEHIDGDYSSHSTHASYLLMSECIKSKTIPDLNEIEILLDASDIELEIDKLSDTAKVSIKAKITAKYYKPE